MQKKNDSDPVARGGDFAGQIRGAENTISRVKEAEIKAEASRKPPFNWKNFTCLALSCASFLIIYRNFPEFAAARFIQQPLRVGPYDTDRKTDRCIQNLWALAAALRAGAGLPALTCPASGAAYITGTSSARCPNPALHGARKLYAEKQNVIPSLE